ncbi:phosphatase domain-containing putative toxin [Luteolibacter soli]|uniref:phosphatase domain-containing putative toxin n=1 Tax=Luteolibacter soli TaxID=3135280 RepID=UPI0035C93625
MLCSPFRPVILPTLFPGRLYLTNMPGYWRPAEFQVRFWQQLTKGDAEGWVVCLAGEAERKRKAPDYWRFLEATELGERWLEFPIRDRSVPEDLPTFLIMLDRLIGLLHSPATVLAIHCAAGVGRTGTVAASLLVRIGLPPDEGLAAIEHAGSEPETARQLAFASAVEPLSSNQLADIPAARPKYWRNEAR